MKTVTLHILAEDIRTSNYTNSRDCAITRALKRAGLEGYHEAGGVIANRLFTIIGETSKELSFKVQGMYMFHANMTSGWRSRGENIVPIPPHDFSFDVELDID